MQRNLIIGILFLAQLSMAQVDCDCTSELNYIIDYYEANLPSFKDNVNAENKSDYRQFKDKLLSDMKRVKNDVECFKLATYYVEFFKDNHSRIAMRVPNVDESDPVALKDFLTGELYTSREIYDLQDAEIRQYPMDDIRGLYETIDASYTILVVPSLGPYRSHIGVIVDSKTKLWKKGQIKIEINKKKEGGHEAFSYMRNHSLRYQTNFGFNNGVLGNAWFKTSRQNKVDYSSDAGRVFTFKLLNDSTSYLRIPTFSGGSSAIIDSVYKASHSTIMSKPYLIVDVRDNGGGSDDNVSHLLKYIYTDPITSDVVDLYVTEDNIKMWEKWYAAAKLDPENYSKGDLKWFAKEIKSMKNAPLNSFISRSKGRTWKKKVYKNGPKKVAVMFNRGCASSCETLLFWSKASGKTVMVGENSGGYVGYGEVGSVQTPCYQYYLYCTMTRYQKQRAFEVVGVAPEYYLAYDQEWIGQTVKLLSGN